jgi:hypothetical protein
MGVPPSEHYWRKHNAKYPFQVAVPHMSPQDPKPTEVQQKVNFHFLRVPFHGQAHWGFLSLADLNKFKSLYHIENDGELS